MNLNIFKRIADLEAEVKILRAGGFALSERIAQLQQSKQTDADKIAKRRAYARAWYASNKKKK